MELILGWRGVWTPAILVTLFTCALAHGTLNGYHDCREHQRPRRGLGVCTAEDNVRFNTVATYGVRATSALIYWIMYSNTNCMVDHYKVTLTRIEYRACPSSAMSSRDIDIQMIFVAAGSRHRMDVTALDPYTTYNVKVTAESADNSVLAEAGIISFTTQNTAPPPVNITGVEVGPTSITLHWMPLTCANVGGNFNYYYVTVDESQRLMSEGINSSSAQFLELQPCTSYRLVIRAMVSGILSSESTETASTTSLSASVVNPEVVQVNSTSVKVRWAEQGSCPRQSRRPSVLVTYQLIRRHACPRHSVGDSEQISKRVTGRRVVLTGLEPYATYRITVTGANNQSSEVEATTSNGDLVDNAEMSQTNSTAIAVRWVVRGGCPDQISRTQVRVTHQLIIREACPTLVVYNWPVMSQFVTQSHAVLTGLEPYATYRIRVVSANTSEVLVTTSSADPRSVDNLRASYLSEDSLTFAWNQPACENLRGNFRGYKYKLMQQSDQRVISDGLTTSTSKDFDNLMPCTSYEFRLQVVTETGTDTRYSETESMTQTTSNAAPGLAQNVSISQLTSTEAYVTWDRPNEPPCPVIYYHVNLYLLNRDLCIPSSSSHRTDSGWVSGQGELRRHLYNLFPYTNYSVCVKGNNAHGYAANDACTLFTTRHAAPGRPVDVNVIEIASLRLTFSWEKPRCGGRHGPITHYECALTDTATGVVVEHRNVSVDPTQEVTTIRIQQLRAFHSYNFKVRACNFDVCGSYSPETTRKTKKPKSPGPPTNITVLLVTATEVIVTWYRPDPQYFTITGYNLSYETSGWQDKDHYVLTKNVACEAPCPRTMQTKLRSLHSGTSYSLQIRALTNNIEGSPNDPILWTTLQLTTQQPPVTALDEEQPLQPVDNEKLPGNNGLKSGSMVPAVTGAVTFLAVLMIVILVTIVYRRKLRKRASTIPVGEIDHGMESSGGSLKMTNEETAGNSEEIELRQSMQRVMNGSRALQPSFSSCESLDGKEVSTVAATAGSSIYENVLTENNKPQPIPIGDLSRYLAEKNSGGLFDLKSEYESLPSEQLHPWDVASREENRTKNRFINILPYDHSRVELTPKEGDPFSDYINASSVDGYKSPGKFIAAQGPNADSVEDFWRMIWQYGCGKIVMLTNLVEGKKRKCEKYWPDEVMNYGDIHVVLIKAEIHPDYAIRTFNIMRDGMKRQVVQYHYTAWPDMAVPEYTAPLVTFIQVTRLIDRTPTVVHCSAGVGRTGTYITLDAMLDQVKQEGNVDVYNFVSGLRQRRFKMVQVVEQYKFIYNALLESQTCGDTRIYPDAFPARYAELIATDPRTGSCPMVQEFRLLDAFSVHPKKTDTIGARSQLNSMKNRYKNKLPVDRMRPYLMTQIDGGTDYINASFLPGFKHKNEFIGTQTPLPETVVDLWRLVVDYKVTCILMLHGSCKDKSFASYFPEKGSHKYGPYTTTLLSKENLNHITCRSIQVIKDDSKKVHEVRQLQLKSCPVQAELPSSIQDVLELYEQLTKARCSEEEGDNTGPVLVHCRDGEGVTGMVCALFAVLERLKADRVVDVFQACKRLRAVRPGAVTMKQYEFIYKAVRTQLDSDSIYQNV